MLQKHTPPTDKDINWLKEKGILDQLSTSECRDFANLIDQIQYQDGEFIFEEGGRDDSMFIIRQGEVEIGHNSKHHAWVDFGPYGSVDLDDKDQQDSEWLEKVVLEAGDCIGEVDALQLDSAHHLSAKAKGPAKMLCLHSSKIRELVATNPKVCSCLAKAMAKTLKKTGQ